MRLFFALEIPESIKEEMARIQADLAEVVPSGMIRWVKPDRAHFTLRFVGERPRSQVGAIIQAAQSVDFPRGPVSLTVSGLGCFPSCSRPRVIWLGVEDAQRALANLADGLDRALEPVGIPSEKRPFTPHLTLGRVNRKRGSPRKSSLGDSLGDFEVDTVGDFLAREMSLFQSQLRPSGPVYSVVHTFPFGDA